VAASVLAENVIGGQVSGLMGLAFSPLAATRSTPFWQALLAGGLLTSPEMSFHLTRERGNPLASEVESGGTFTLGGTNSSLFTGDIEFLDLPSAVPTFWVLNMAGR
jgi:cathepsin D